MNALPSIRRLDPADSGTAGKLVDLDLAALAVDDPGGPEWSRHVNRTRLTLGPPIGSPSEVWWVPGGVPGGIAAWYQLWLHDRENLRSSRLQLIVHPAARRQELGTALLGDAAERARASGRLRLDGLVIQGSAGTRSPGGPEPASG
jgi:GNAT superfamily N-acetyltransferase